MLRCLADVLIQCAAKMVQCLMLSKSSDRNDCFVRFGQHLFRLQKTYVKKFFHWRAGIVFSERLFESAAEYADVPGNVGHADGLVNVFMYETQRSDHLRVFHCQAVGTATFDDLVCRNVDGVIRTGFTPHQTLQ